MTEPWKHQRVGVDGAHKYPGYMLAHDMGTGKSCSAVLLSNEIDARLVLILCPKSVIDVWPKQFRIHSQKSFDVLPLSTGSVKKKAEKLANAVQMAKIRRSRLVVIVNYESAWRSGLGPDYNKKNNKIIHWGEIMRHTWDLVIADESHRIKSPRSKASWFCYQLTKNKKAKRRLLLTGTPMPHSPLDIYAQFRFLDPSIFNCNYHQFQMRYAEMVNMGDFKKVIGYKNEEDLNAKFYSRAHRVMKSDVLDLPPVMHETRTCTLAPKAYSLYRELENEFCAWVEEYKAQITVQNVLVKLLRLNQLSGGYLQLDDQPGKVVDDSKLGLLADIFEDLPTQEPIVVFTRFTNEIERIKALAEKMGRPAAEISGQMNQLAEWQAGRWDVLAVQIRSGGVGVDLTRAHYTVYYSKGHSLGDYEQSLARTDRPGQTKDGVFYHLVASGTVDEDIDASLREKKAVVEYVLEQCNQRRK